MAQVHEFKRAIESIVLVAHDPVPPELLAQLIEQPTASIERWCDELAADYRSEGRGFELARVAGGYRYQTAADLTPYVERFLLHDQRARLSGPALETLAIVAYKQPISRAQVAAIRGVDPDGVMRTLQARGYIDEVARDTGPGQAILYGTTATFLERLGLDSVDDLPPIAEFIPGADVVEALEDGLRVTPVIEVGPTSVDARASRRRTPRRRSDASRRRIPRQWHRILSRSHRSGSSGPSRARSSPRASGCRRYSPPPGGGAGGCARS